jgi:general secretion pathway protein B
MSFILDALRKSEHARQHHKGPVLAEVPIVPTKPKTNVWAAAAVALLIVNLVAVGVWMLGRAQRVVTTAAVATAPGASTGSPADAVAGRNTVGGPANPLPPGPSHPEPTLTPEAQVAVTQTPRGTLQPIAPPATGTRNPLAAEVSEGAAGSPDAEIEARAARVPPGPPAVTTRGGSRPGSVTYATVPEANDTPYSAPAVKPETPQQEALPTADEVVARGGVPPLHLDLHVYSDVVAQRFIFVNSRKYKEGETLQEGPVVERITVDGAVLNFRGSRFKLSQD